MAITTQQLENRIKQLSAAGYSDDLIRQRVQQLQQSGQLQIQSEAPMSEALQKRGFLGNVLGSITQPIERWGRMGLGSAEAVGVQTAALVGGDKTKQWLQSKGYGDKNLSKLLSDRQEGVLTSKSSAPAIKEGFNLAADVLPYVIPVGGVSGKAMQSGIRPTVVNALKTGALRGASGAYGRTLYGQEGNEIINPELGASAIMGGVVGAGLEGATVGASNWLANRKTAQKRLEAPEFMKRDAAKGYTKATPSQEAKIIEARGKGSQELAQKYIPEGTSYDDYLGATSERNRGGIWKKQMNKAEETIKASVENVGKGKGSPKISIDDFIDELKGDVKALKKLPGNESEITALNKIIKNTQQQYKNGITYTQALEIKRSVDNEFGKRVLDEGTGSVAAQFQKRLGNYVRQELKAALPDAADALESQSDLFALKELVTRARGTLNTQGSEIRRGAFNSATDLVNPKFYYDKVMNDPKMASRIMSGGVNSPSAKIPDFITKNWSKLNPQVRSAILQNAMKVPAIVGGNSQGTQLPQTSMPQGMEMESQLSQYGMTPSITSQMGSQYNQEQPTDLASYLGISRQDLALIAQLPAEAQNQIIQKIITEKVTKKDTTDKKMVGAIQQVDQLLNLHSQMSTGQIGGRISGAGRYTGGVKAAEYESLQTGLAPLVATALGLKPLTPIEVEMIKDEFLPSLKDTKAQARAKAQRVKDILNAYAGGAQTETEVL